MKCANIFVSDVSPGFLEVTDSSGLNVQLQTTKLHNLVFVCDFLEATWRTLQCTDIFQVVKEKRIYGHVRVITEICTWMFAQCLCVPPD